MSDQMMAQLDAAAQDHDQLAGQDGRRCQPGEQIRNPLREPIQAHQRQIGIGRFGEQIKQWLMLVGPVIDDPFCRHRVDEASPRQRALHRLDPDHELDAISSLLPRRPGKLVRERACCIRLHFSPCDW